MPAPEIVIDFKRAQPFEWGALLVAVLAFPEQEPPTGLMERCFYSLCAVAIRGRVAANPDIANRALPMKPAYAFQDPQLIERDCGYLTKRLWQRMLAAKMVIPFLMQAQNGTEPELPPGMKRLSINQMAEMVLEESGYTEAKNVISRIWRPSLPVIHLTACIAIISNECLRQGLCDQPMTFADLMASPPLLRRVIEQAQEVEKLLAQSPRAHVDSGSLIRFRLAA